MESFVSEKFSCVWKSQTMLIVSDSEKFEPPLSFLFQDGGNNSDSATLLYKLHTSENIQWVSWIFLIVSGA